ncbi:hypothetical protein [Streptomyces sp. HC307]|uniref:hypothetical protein n=1 Tax=Streptomyces flavusporus TaxID=3385496 RepID=UPI003917383E
MTQPAAAAASAPAIPPTAKCTLELTAGGGSVTANGTGFTGGAQLQVRKPDGTPGTTVIADAAGNATVPGLTPPTPPASYFLRESVNNEVKQDVRCSTLNLPPEMQELPELPEQVPGEPGQSEQEQARAEFIQGQKDGFALGR